MVSTIEKGLGEKEAFAQQNNPSQVKQSQVKQSRIVEMVGPAGAGKTTLARTLCQNNPTIQIGEEIQLRKFGHISTALGTLPSLLPFWLHSPTKGRAITWNEAKAIAFLTGWQHIFRKQAAQPGALILLDHGPVFKLATLHAFGPDRLRHNPLRSKHAEAWWAGMFQKWASELDMIVWLDAPNPILESRIHARSQRHAVKGKSTAEVMQFLETYRRSYEYVLAKLADAGAPSVLRFDTSQTAIHTIAHKIQVANE